MQWEIACAWRWIPHIAKDARPFGVPERRSPRCMGFASAQSIRFCMPEEITFLGPLCPLMHHDSR